MLISIYTIHMGYCCLWFPMVSRSESFPRWHTHRCGSQTAPSRRHLGEQRDRSQKAKKAIMALGFLDIFGRFGDKIGLCMSLESEFSCGCLRFTIFRQTLDLRWTPAFANQQGKQKNKPGASTERLQPWRELASHDLCQLAWIFRRHSWYVQRDLEVWSHDRGCVGGVQASHLYLHPQARWVAWWCLGGHWSGHQPWEDGDLAVQKGFALPRFLVFFGKALPLWACWCPTGWFSYLCQNTPEYPRIPQIYVSTSRNWNYKLH